MKALLTSDGVLEAALLHTVYQFYTSRWVVYSSPNLIILICLSVSIRCQFITSFTSLYFRLDKAVTTYPWCLFDNRQLWYAPRTRCLKCWPFPVFVFSQELKLWELIFWLLWLTATLPCRILILLFITGFASFHFVLRLMRAVVNYVVLDCSLIHVTKLLLTK